MVQRLRGDYPRLDAIYPKGAKYLSDDVDGLKKWG